MFSNAFTNPRPLAPVELVACEQRAAKPSARWVQRTIERWQTRAFIQEAVDQLGLSGHYELASFVLQSGTDGGPSPDGGRRVYERMRLAGEPWVGKQLELLANGHMSQTGRWIQSAIHLVPETLVVLNEPIWRLIDPLPLTHVEWHDLGERVLAHVATGLPELPPAPLQVVVEDPTEPKEPPTVAFVPTAKANSRWNLCIVLLQLRRWEVNGQLVDYYLNLLEAMHRLDSSDVTPCLGALQPECREYLATCFGRVHIGFPHQGNYDHQQQRLAAAYTAFMTAKRRIQRAVPLGEEH